MRHGVRQVTVGEAHWPFAITVKPNVVLPPAGTLPLPLGFMVITVPVESQLGVPFQVLDTLCGEVTVTVAVQLVIAEEPARIVTSPLKRSPHRWLVR
ncbi:hypothetical protein B0I31_13230 [Saccharothrix carnea]|uniref:Uncharacterized protein n=1 Tax=Saccharothrix carnea TaxID=1280637 RepID=A0A2P8HAC8_SACCR|nr:hypothetical protein B0I31_13230 [Saccharothrix carnea]